MGASILIVDDEKSVQNALSMALEGKYSVTTAARASGVLKLVDQERPDLILLDIGLTDMDGLDLLGSVKDKAPDAVVIMVTALDKVKMIVEAVKLGAYDYLVKPIDAQELFLTLQNALYNKRLKDQIRTIQHPSIDRYELDLIGQSPQTRAMIQMARKLSESVDTPDDNGAELLPPKKTC